MGSNGSVIPFFMRKRSEGVLPITDEGMTRFNISLDGGVDMVFHAIENAMGGEIFIPKIPSYKVTDVADAIDASLPKPVVGIRPGEKLHEEMITASDSFNTYDLGKYYAILPKNKIEKFTKVFECKRVPDNFSYNSKDNNDYETIDSLKEKIKSLNIL